MKRSAQLRRWTFSHTEIRPKTCEYEKCGREFIPSRMGQKVCGPVCAGRKAKADRIAKKAQERAELKARKEALKTIPQLISAAQDAFNAFIRERDKHKGCFVCGKPFDLSGPLGGSMDAGHVRSRGAAGHLRFVEDNCHGECKACNRPNGAKPHHIKAGAIARIGAERFSELENDNAPHKWTRDELTGIRDLYRQKLKELKKEAQ